MNRVLLVEDNPGDARLIAELLREASNDYAIDHVATLRDATEHARDHDVALLDLTLPDASGIAGVQQLAAHARGLPIVVLTGNADERVAIEALNAGAQDYLRKDEIVPALLAKAIRYAIERKRMVALEIAQQQLEEAIARTGFVAAVTAAATSSLEIAACMRAVAPLLVPVLGDACTIELHRDGRVDQIASAGEKLDGERLTLPLLARGRAMGAIVLASRRPMPDNVRLLAEEVAGRIALGIDNAILFDDAQRAIRGRDEMIAIVSHDLRNPLGVVQISLGMIGENTTSAVATLPRAIRAVEQMRLLIEDLLQIGQIDAGTFVIEPHRVDLAPILDDVYEHHRLLARRKQIHVRREVAQQIGSVDIDTRRLSQALGNLLGNAIKYTPPNGEIVLGAQRRDGNVVISVRDTGPGIAPDAVPRIFERFWQADRKRDGVGLGLPIAKGIVESHGGRIEVASELGRGTTFEIILPPAGAAPVV